MTSAATTAPTSVEPVKLFFAEVGRQFGAQAALCNAVTAEGANGRDNLVGQLCAAQWYGGEQHQSANLVRMLRGDQLGDLRAEALADHDHRPVDSLEDIAGLGGQRLQRALHASAIDPLRVPNPGRS